MNKEKHSEIFLKRIDEEIYNYKDHMIYIKSFFEHGVEAFDLYIKDLAKREGGIDCKEHPYLTLKTLLDSSDFGYEDGYYLYTMLYVANYSFFKGLLKKNSYYI
jgi:hypothetical protein